MRYTAPNWTYNKMANPSFRFEILKKKLSKQKNDHLLPNYPITNEEGCGDDLIRKRRKSLWRKVVFETK